MKTPADLTVLIVDDNDYARAIAETSLKKWGIGNVMDAADGADGLAMLSEHAIDLVLLDWYMPEINGAGFVRMARANGHNVAILVTTAYATKDNITRMRELGLHDMLVKPFEPAQLHKAIMEVLSASNTGLDDLAG